LYVEDAGSTNGTFVNDRKTVGATALSSGDRVRVGSTTFRYSE
jgi:pSer/pThr/pTyr-binding forkhead associated (FHA) protein